MGDRYEFSLNCTKCLYSNQVYYAPSSGFTTFKCEMCGQFHRIQLGFTAIPITEEEYNSPICEE